MGNVLGCFRLPSGLTISSRKTVIRKAFATAILPANPPAEDEVRQVLEILGMIPENLRCAYCGDPATEWDHLRPVIEDGWPTGYPSSIRNLVPACGKCNQSKGNTDWRKWILGPARLSPKTRNKRIERLEAYEQWAQCSKVDVRAMVDAGTLARYDRLQEEIAAKMAEAQELAAEIRKSIRVAVTAPVAGRG